MILATGESFHVFQEWRIDSYHRSRSWAESRGIHAEFIHPGKPQQNANVERYNRTV
ncbi:integrase core domain-containing protein [Candidatus Saccharibacteria bacterium]|nr:integrase core domain-containing protein [Candidatus Saccharibacteria bacterium]